MKQLHTLKVKFCKALQSRAPLFLQVLSISAPNIRFLNFSGLELPESVLSIYLNFNQALQVFTYAHNFALKSFRILPSYTIRHLRLCYCLKLEYIVIEKPNNCIRVLDLSNSRLPDFKNLFKVLDECTELEELIVSGSGITDATVERLTTAFPSLTITNIPPKKRYDLDFDGNGNA